MKIPDDILARLALYYKEYADTLEEAKYTPDGVFMSHPRLSYLRHAIECAREDARKWLLMEDRSDYVEVMMVRDAQHAYEIHKEIEHQFDEWKANHHD